MIKNYLFVVLFLLVSGVCLSQTSDINWQFNNEPLSEVLKEIERSNGLLFSFKNDDLKDLLVNCSIVSDKLETALNLLFKETPFFYTLSGGNFVLLNTTKRIQVSGRAGSQDSEEALAYANVYVKDGPGTSTDAEGNFSLDLEIKKGDQLVISYLSFEPEIFLLEEWDTLQHYDFKLKSSASTFGDYLVIKDYITDGIELTDNGSATKLKPRYMGSFAGEVNPEVLSLAKILPGINSPSAKASDLRIRGCTPDQNLIVWEDIPIYHAAHYFGMISAINPFTIEEINIYRGGFGAEYGGRIGGVVDMKSSGTKSLNSYYGLGTNMTHGFLYGNHKFSVKRPSAINFSLRRSFSEVLRTPTFDNITKINQQGLLIGNKEVQTLPDHISIKDDFNFVDGQIKFSSQLNKKNHISFAGIFAINSFSDRIVDDKKNEAHRDSMYLNNRGLSLSWNHKWSKRNEAILKLVSTQYQYDYDYQLSQLGTSDLRLSGTKRNTIWDQQISFISKNRIRKQQILESAYQYINYNIFYRVEELSANSKDIKESARTHSGLHTIYSIFKNPISNKIGINAGLRSSYYMQDDKFYFEPRIRLSKSLNKYFSLHSNFGRHYQFVSQVLTFRGNDNGISSAIWALAEKRSIPVQKSDLYQIGLIYNKSSWLLDVQLYRRNISDLSTRAFQFVITDDATPSIGSGKIHGLDILLKKRMGNFKSWMSYSYTQAKYLFNDLDPEYFVADHNQLNTFKWGTQYSTEKFNISVAYKYASGLPYSIINDFVVEQQQMGQDIFAPRYDGINNYNLSSQQDLDIALGYRLTRANSFSCYVDLSISNILNRENISAREYYIDAPKNEMPFINYVDRATLPFTPNLGLRIEW